jgi:hypothetical protein
MACDSALLTGIEFADTSVGACMTLDDYDRPARIDTPACLHI